MADLTISVDLDASGVQKGTKAVRASIAGMDLEKLGNSLKSVGSMMQQFGGQLQGVGTTLSIAVTAPLVAAGVAVLKAGADYEKSLNIFQAVTKATASEMTRASQVAKDLGADLSLPATSAGDAARAMNELGKAGLTANQAMDAAKGVLQLAAAGAIEEARAAEIAANALNAFGLEAKETTRIADLLAAAANASSSEVDDLALSLQQSGAVFAAAKIPIEDLVAAIGVMANAGIKGQDAGTSLKQFLLSIEAPTKVAANVMKQLGVEAFDASGKLRDLPGIIGQFQTALAGLTDEDKAKALQKIFGSDAIRAAQILFNTGTEGFNKMKEAVTANGAAAELANARMKGLAGAWEGFKSQLETIGIQLYEVVKAPLTNFLQQAAVYAGQLGDSFSRLSPFLQQAVIAFVALVAALGPVLVVAGTLITAIGTIASAVGAVVAAIGGGSVLAIALAAIVAVLAEAAVVAAALYLAWQTNFGGIRELTAVVADAVVVAWNAAMAALKELTQAILAEIQAFWKENGDQIMEIVKFVSELIKSEWTIVVNFWRENSETIKAVTSIVWEAVKTLIVTVIRTIADVITVFLKVLKGDWKGALDALLDLSKIGWEAIGAVIKAGNAVILGLVKLMFTAIWDLNVWVMQKAAELGNAIGEGLAQGIRAMKDRVVGAAQWLASQIPESIRNLLIIRSPSKVMHDIGLQVAQGLISGLFAGQRGVAVAGDSLGKRLLNSVLGGLFGGSAGSSSSSGGGGFGGILGGIFGGGGGPGGTPVFNGGGGSSSGGGFGSWIRGIFGDRTGSTDSNGNVIVDGRSFFKKFLSSGIFGGLIGMGASLLIKGIGSLFGRNSLRRKEETIRNQGMLDAFSALKQYDDIISDVRTLRIDSASGIAQGQQLGTSVRSQYLDMANSLKDKKTRSHALADVSRIDTIIAQKMAELRGVAEIAGAAAARDRRMLPEFAGGVFMSPAFMNFRRRNGMLGGAWTGRDTIPAMLAHGEMVLNPMQQRSIIANAGFDVLKTAKIPGYAGGGVVSTERTAGNETIMVELSIQQDSQGMFSVAAKSPTGRKVLLDVVGDGFANDDLKLKRR